MAGPLKVTKQYRELNSVPRGWVQDLSSLLATTTKAQGSLLPAKVHGHSYFFFNLNIYLFFVTLGLGYSTKELLLCLVSVVEACELSCPAACGVLVPGPGIKTTSSALEDGFFTGPPGESS